jgi:dTDP-glucose 4,6-dehydratase
MSGATKLSPRLNPPERLSGVPDPPVVEIAPDRPAKDQAYLMDSSKARIELGWSDEYSFERGVDETIHWVKASLDEIRGSQLEYIYKA